MDKSKCPHCGKLLLHPMGNPKAKLLLVGEFPGWEEIRQGTPFAGRVMEILQTELMRAGLQVRDCRLTYMWQHAEDEKNCDIKWHIDQMVKEFAGKTHVLLMGASTVRAILGDKSGNFAGTLLKVPTFKGIRFWASPSPLSVFNSPVGELRMSIERFVSDTQKG